MRRDDSVYLEHMLDFAQKIASKTVGSSQKQWELDEDLQIITIHLLQNIGEAAQRVSGNTRDRYAQIPWNDIIGMRNRIVHDYLRIRLKVVWSVIQIELPDLIAKLETIIQSDGNR